MAVKKTVQSKKGFKTGEFIVYPAHGVGQITSIETEVIADQELELFVIHFETDKMTLRVPTFKVEEVCMRKLSDKSITKKSLDTLKTKPRVKRTMWSRRAQEYEAKINSGNLVAVAEVVRDLFRGENQPEQSYSERQLYELALDRMGREISATKKVDQREAVEMIVEILVTSAAKTSKAKEAENDDSADKAVA